MRGMFDFSSWSALASTVLSLLLMTLMMMGMRLLFMQTIQKRRERENRQINERLRTLMAAYKTLGGSFTGNLTVSPMHLREARAMTQAGERPEEALQDAVDIDEDDETPAIGGSSERQRRTRDVVEAALSDIILLGTEDQVRMAAQAAQDMVAGRPVQTAALVTSLRQFIRAALYLETIPPDIAIPNQGPLRPNTAGGPGARRGNNAEGGANAGGRGGAGGGGGGAGGGGGGMGMGLGMGARRSDEQP
jgi:heme exporter protein D